MAEVNRARKAEQEIRAFALLNENLRFYNNLAVWQYTLDAAARFEELRKLKIRVGTHDLKIAAIALANGATLLTRNTRDFERVPGLLFEDWSA